jgi:hypothetical protein
MGVKPMRYRRLDANGDYVFGHGLTDFWIDTPETVAQAAQTRLQLKLGEWFNDTSDGTDWNTKILGKGTTGTRDVELKSRITGTPGLNIPNGIDSYASNLSVTRQFIVTVTLNTIYGQVTLSGPL